MSDTQLKELLISISLAMSSLASIRNNVDITTENNITENEVTVKLIYNRSGTMLTQSYYADLEDVDSVTSFGLGLNNFIKKCETIKNIA